MLGWLGRSDVLSLDTGCVWGGCLSALRVGGAGPADSSLILQQELIQVQCAQAQKPG
jgi:bis(5'-nucleosyl)-tetraphosphatase (symmetrical)